MMIQCQGWNASVLSFGRTSQPQVSKQIAAISFLWIHSQVSKRSPGASPAAYEPQSPLARHYSIWPVRTITKSPRRTSTPCFFAHASSSALPTPKPSSR